MDEKKIGTVEDVKFTSNGLGNQFTTIDGHRYMTWWDMHTHPVRVGKKVEYSVRLNQQVCHSPAMFADVATIHRILADDCTKPDGTSFPARSVDT